MVELITKSNIQFKNTIQKLYQVPNVILLWAEGGHAVKGDKRKGGRSSIQKVGDLAVCSHPLAEQGQERMKDELLRSQIC